MNFEGLIALKALRERKLGKLQKTMSTRLSKEMQFEYIEALTSFGAT
jgi:hypothetical protein